MDLVALADHVVDDRIDGSDSSVSGENLSVWVNLSPIEVWREVLGNFLSEKWHSSDGGVLVGTWVLDCLLKVIKKEFWSW